MVNIPQHVIDIPTALRDRRRAQAFLHPFFTNIGGTYKVRRAQAQDWVPESVCHEAPNLFVPETKVRRAKGKPYLVVLLIGLLAIIGYAYNESVCRDCALQRW